MAATAADADTFQIGGCAMATRMRQEPVRRKPRRDAEAEQSTRRRHGRGDDVKHDLDDLLDEIDEVLEENAEEFVKAFVQKGGQ